MKSIKHVFKPSEEDREFCGYCGKNWRNTDYHLTTEEFNKPKLPKRLLFKR